MDLPPTPPTQHLEPSTNQRAKGEFNVFCYTLLSLFLVSFGVWFIFAWIGYGDRYAATADGWYKGGIRSIELTLIREDRQNLGCASDVILEGVHCERRANQQPFDVNGTEDHMLLRPYNTVDQVLFLGSGLWSSPGLQGTLPAERFSVVCNYRMLGAIKSVELRWSPEGPFSPVGKSIPVGILSDCVIPQ